MNKAKSGFVNPAELMDKVRQQPGAHTNGPGAEGNPRVIVPFVLRLQEPLHLDLKHVAAHTLGESMQSFAVRAIREAVEKRMAELSQAK